ncbi:MAG TPA: hypothetical protein VJ521_10640, partial [Acidobacteriota bacterium]|nr:hypothetical protein [Acidobacteriota bacterium]
HYDISARYSIEIRATPERIYEIVQHGIPTGTITSILMTLRRVPRLFHQERKENAIQDAFYKLKHLKNRELVIGVIGQFWKPVSRLIPVYSLEEFLELNQEGFCKAALNLLITRKSDTQSVLTTETRVLGFGSAKRHFRKYWLFIGPFSGMIRREVLRKIKSKVESS